MAFFKKNDLHTTFLDGILDADTREMHVKELMIERAINLISKTCAKSEFQVYKKKEGKIKRVVDDVYYILNIRPNPNEDGPSFWKKVYSFLLRNGKALVVQIDNNLFMATDWEIDNAFKFDKTYHNIELVDTDGNSLKFERSFRASDVLYFDMGDHQSVELLNNFYENYSKMVAASIKNFNRTNARKWGLSHPAQVPIIQGKDGHSMTFDEYSSNITKKLFSDDDATIPIANNFTLQELGEKKEPSTKFIEIIKDFGDKVAVAFDIPLDVFWGVKTEKSQGTDDFITFAVQYPLKVIESGLNAKLISKKEYLDGSRILQNQFTMKHFDIMNVASSWDKLFSTGWSFNMLREILGLPRIEESWADKSHVTKNYMSVEDGEGGD